MSERASGGSMARRALAALSFACGLHFAVLQTSYFFLLEAYLSSRSHSYFVALFFWLIGLLAGLNLRGGGWLAAPRGEDRLAVLLGAGVAGYYVAWSLARWISFDERLYAITALCAVVSGLLPGAFFRFVGRSGAKIRGPLFHENNGFLVGLAVALKGAVLSGSALLAWGPLAGAALVASLLLAERGQRSEQGDGETGRRERES